MTLAGMVMGYASVGFGVRCYALAIQRRNVLDNLGGHAMTALAFGGIGYYFHGLEGRQNDLIERKKQEIQENRTRLLALQDEGRKAMGGGDNDE